MHAAKLVDRSHLAGLISALAGFWLVLSGHYTPLLLAFGALSVGLVVWLSHRMNAVAGRVPLWIGRPDRVFAYALWLSGQIAWSSLAVIKQVWTPGLTPHPAVGSVPTGDTSDLGTVVYANSITLTPGTLAMRILPGSIEVHALRGSDLEELRGGAMLDRVRHLEVS